MSQDRVILVGAVHESLAAFAAIDNSPDAELVAVVTLTDSAARTVSGVVDLAGLARSRGIEVIRVDDVNAPHSVAAIRALAPDLIAVVGWTRLIHDELLDLPRRGCIGFHASLLPRHRGRAPVNWSIIKGESQTGNTMMLLNSGVDTGLIVDQRSTPIGESDTCATVYDRVAALGADMLRDNLAPLLRGEAKGRRQDDAASNLLPKRTPAMGVTDWRRSAREVHDWIRAQTAPYPGAFTHLASKHVKLWSSQVPKDTVDDDSSWGKPGEILDISDAGIRVATGSGSLLITSAGDDAGTPALDWALSHGIKVGAHFDLPHPSVVLWSLGQGPKPKEASA